MGAETDLTQRQRSQVIYSVETKKKTCSKGADNGKRAASGAPGCAP